MEIDGNGGWVEYKKLVVHMFEDHEKRLDRLDDKITHSIQTSTERIEMRIRDVEREIVSLKVKAASWGAISGAIPGIAIIVGQYLSG